MSLSRVNVLPWLGFCVVLTSSPMVHVTEMIGVPGVAVHFINHLVLSRISNSPGFIQAVLNCYFSPPSQQSIGEVWDEISEHLLVEQTIAIKKHRHHHGHHKAKSPPISPRIDTTQSSLSDDLPPPPLVTTHRRHEKHL